VFSEHEGSTNLGEEDLSDEASLRISNTKNDIYQPDVDLQPTALANVHKTSRTFLTSTMQNLIGAEIVTSPNNETNYSQITDNETIHSVTESVNTGTTASIYSGPTVCVNGTSYPVGPLPTNLSEIPTKEIIIVLLMLSLWLYAIHLTRRAWVRLLK
jgi:hypothetical protein